MTLLKVSSGTLSSTSINFHARDHDTTPRMRRLPSIPILSTKTIQPRVCGDYVFELRFPWFHADTTPRMRGLLPTLQLINTGKRYNPAYAGTTVPAIHAGGLRRIQPRVCGDYDTPLFAPHAERDTTPRMRGLPQTRIEKLPRARYNPAYAGTTRSSMRSSYPAAIQPRVCGDYAAQSSAGESSPDTTPRMRGLLVKNSSQPARRRYNPAYAGTTYHATSSPHP